jgi:hypothetical protein
LPASVREIYSRLVQSLIKLKLPDEGMVPGHNPCACLHPACGQLHQSVGRSLIVRTLSDLHMKGLSSLDQTLDKLTLVPAGKGSDDLW